MEKTYSNATWQDRSISAFKDVADGNRARLTDLGLALGLSGYPSQAEHNGQVIEKTAFQYFENHDHSRLLCRFGVHDLYNGAILEGNRDHWYKLQPHIVALLLSKGVPLLWEGQEIGENYSVPHSGMARIGRLRPVRWEFFYDTAGKQLVSFYRQLLELRANNSVFRRGEYFFHNHWERWQSRGLLLFSRYSGDGSYALVVLNFTDGDLSTEFWLPISGTYRDALGGPPVTTTAPNEWVSFEVPSNYARVLIKD